jgi:hypothetical protein
MGYFPNGTSGMIYEEQYCYRCIHRNGRDGKSGCAVMLAHNLFNYEHCNTPDSILHLLIPKTKDGIGNATCEMFVQGEPPQLYDTKRMLPEHAEWLKKNAPQLIQDPLIK